MPERSRQGPRQIKRVEYILIYKIGNKTVYRLGQKTTYVYYIPICRRHETKYPKFENRRNLEIPPLHIPYLRTAVRMVSKALSRAGSGGRTMFEPFSRRSRKRWRFQPMRFPSEHMPPVK